MIRSLNSGVMSLKNHQLSMDVTSHNIANVNTKGYKASRVTFKESMAQMLTGATRPVGNRGGINPMQVGLGMEVGSIDSIMGQGALNSTGQITDLAITGRSYFAFSSGSEMLYSRNGAFQIDGEGNLVSPSNGYRLQGVSANHEGVYSPTAVPDDIRIPYGEKSPAKATDSVGFACNLNSDSAGLGTVMHTAQFLTYPHGTDSNGDGVIDEYNDSLTNLFDSTGNSLGIKEGDELSIEWTNGADITDKATINVGTGSGEVSTLQELARAIEDSVSSNPSLGSVTAQVNPDGTVGITGGLLPLKNISVVNRTRPTSNVYTANVFNWFNVISTSEVKSKGSVRSSATENDLLSNTLDASGKPLGFEDGDTISVGGAIGLDQVADEIGLSYNSATTTMKDLLSHIQMELNLPNNLTGPDGNDIAAVSINGATGDDRAPVGSIVIRGQVSEAFALKGISVNATNADGDKTAPLAFNSNMVTTDIQAARDTGVHATSIEVYDEAGDVHTVTMNFTHSGQPNEWLWEISMNGGENLLEGASGTLKFGLDGSPSSWNFNDDTSKFSFNPMNGSNNISIDLNYGGAGLFTGITQFRAATTTTAKEQNGYGMGKLSDIAITERGEIRGSYSNGVTRSLSKILLADFNNPAGLLRVNDGMLRESLNSGEVALNESGKGTFSKVKPGALEMSNVDLASEFTNLITIQRGYSASGKVITASDSLLQELTQLVR